VYGELMAGRERAEGVSDDDGPLADLLPFPSLGRAPAEPRPAEPEPRLRTVIGDVLRDERLDQDRTLAEVAERAAVSLPYLSEVERGVKEVSSDVLASICEALELPLADVLERSVLRLRPRPQGGSGIQLLAA
jgi:DNA-binding Xre family transcriptional regulator